MNKSKIQKKHTLICVIIFSIHTCIRVQYKKIFVFVLYVITGMNTHNRILSNTKKSFNSI